MKREPDATRDKDYQRLGKPLHPQQDQQGPHSDEGSRQVDNCPLAKHKYRSGYRPSSSRRDSINESLEARIIRKATKVGCGNYDQQVAGKKNAEGCQRGSEWPPRPSGR